MIRRQILKTTGIEQAKSDTGLILHIEVIAGAPRKGATGLLLKDLVDMGVAAKSRKECDRCLGQIFHETGQGDYWEEYKSEYDNSWVYLDEDGSSKDMLKFCLSSDMEEWIVGVVQSLLSERMDTDAVLAYFTISTDSPVIYMGYCDGSLNQSRAVHWHLGSASAPGFAHSLLHWILRRAVVRDYYKPLYIPEFGVWYNIREWWWRVRCRHFRARHA